jgi:hypothetical protein
MCTRCSHTGTRKSKCAGQDIENEVEIAEGEYEKEDKTKLWFRQYPYLYCSENYRYTKLAFTEYFGH